MLVWNDENLPVYFNKRRNRNKKSKVNDNMWLHLYQILRYIFSFLENIFCLASCTEDDYSAQEASSKEWGNGMHVMMNNWNDLLDLSSHLNKPFPLDYEGVENVLQNTNCHILLNRIFFNYQESKII